MRKLLDWLKSEKGRRIVRYGLVGGATTALNYGLFWLLNRALALEINLSNIIAILLSILFAYILNKAYVFRSHCETKKALAREAARFFAARGLTMLLDEGAIFLVHTVIGVGPQWAMLTKLIANMAVLIANYFLSKRLVFKNSK